MKLLVEEDYWTLTQCYVPTYHQVLLMAKTSSVVYSPALMALQSHEWLLPIVTQYESQGEMITLYENFDGIPLQQLMTQPLSIESFFKIAEQLCHACMAFHRNELYYLRLNPATILVHPKTYQLKVVPTEMVSNWRPTAYRHVSLYEQHYIAPEQTGKLIYEIDGRADLYALGVIFYELLYGSLNRMTEVDELYFRILTFKPKFPFKTAQHAMFEPLLQKLLEKNPQQRYQSAAIVKNELLLLKHHKQLQQPVPQQDLLQEIPIFGRDEPLALIQQHFQEVAIGQKRFISIYGEAGVGKSYLLHAVKQDVYMQRGYYIVCQFDADTREGIAALFTPFRQLLQALLLKGADFIMQLSAQLEAVDLVVTENFIQYMPELEQLHCKIAPEQELHSTLQQYQYIVTAFQKLLTAVAALKVPVVFVFEDCHYVDEGLLKMVEQLYQQHVNGYLMMLSTYRISPTMQLPNISIEHSEEITLTRFNEQDVHLWITGLFDLQEEVAANLSTKLFYYTGGHPLYVVNSCRAMQQLGAIYYDDALASWQMDERLVAESLNAHSFEQFLISQLARWPQQQAEIIEICSCFSAPFTLEMIQQITPIETYVMKETLQRAKELGLIVPAQQGEQQRWQFAHQTIEQTIYERMDVYERQHVHYAIFHRFSTELPRYITIHHLMQSMSIMTPAEQQAALNLLYEEALANYAAGMYRQAQHHFIQCLKLVPQFDWGEQLLTIYLAIGECAYLADEAAVSNHYITLAFEQAVTKVQKLAIYKVLMFLYLEDEKSDEMQEVVEAAFAICNITIQRPQKREDLVRNYFYTELYIRCYKHRLRTVRKVEDEALALLQEIVITYLSSSYRLNGNTTMACLFTLIRLTLKHGEIASTPVLLMNYALVIIIGFGNIKQAKYFAEMAMQRIQHLTDARIISRTYFLYGTLQYHFENMSVESAQSLRLAQQQGSAYGLHSIYSATAILSSCFKWHKGISLKEMDTLLRYEEERLAPLKTITASEFLSELRHWVGCLQQVQRQPVWTKPITNDGQLTVFFLHQMYRLQMAYLYREEAIAKRIIEELVVVRNQRLNIITSPYYFFYEAMWLAHFIEKGETDYEALFQRRLKSVQRFAKTSPHLYSHLYHCLLAEQERLAKADKKALHYYEEALKNADMQQVTIEQAVILERISSLYEKTHVDLAQTYRQKALEKLEKWGAYAIVRRWQQQATFYVKKQEAVTYDFDVQTILSVTNVLTEEIMLEELLHKLLYTLLKHANATAGYVIEVNGDALKLQAELHAPTHLYQYYEQPVQVRASMQNIAHYVYTKKEAYIYDATHSFNRSQDVSSAQSILCAPVYLKGEMIALIYLEHDTLPYAFQQEQLTFIQLISTQIAAALENAKLYAQLEERVAIRTAQYEESHRHLVHANEQLEKAEAQRKKLLQNISHDLRTPLTSTIGYIDCILDEVVTDETQKIHYLQRSKERLFTMERLIVDLFEMVKLEANELRFDYEVIDSKTLLAEVERYAHETLSASNLVLQVMPASEPIVYMWMDRARFMQVVSNIISNAMKYAANGSLTISCTCESQFQLAFQDTGAGIDAEHLPFIFEHYYKGAQRQSNESTGIGLAFSQQIMHQMNGTIDVASEVGKGTTFTLSLPTIDIEEEEA